MPALRSPTLVAVAKEAGVSRMTVSRVLRNAGYVAAPTKERVFSAVRKLSYRPNPMVSAFMSYVRSGSVDKRAGVLAYLTSGAKRGVWRNHDTYLQFHDGAFERAERLGYRLEEYWLNQPDLSSQRLSRILYARGICGVVVAPMGTSHGHLNLDWDKFSAAAIGYSLLKPYLPRVSNDQYNSVLTALRELRKLGYRRVGLAMARRDDERVHYHWSAGYLSFQQRWKQRNSPGLYMPRDWNRDSALAWVEKTKPDAVVATELIMYEWLTEAGYRFPEDVGFVHLDWSAKFPHCAGIDQAASEVGSAAVDIVVEQINHNKFGLPARQRTVMLPGQWVPGPTLRSLART